jgi:hypothetical protein
MPVQTRDAIVWDACHIQRQQRGEGNDMRRVEWFGKLKVCLRLAEDLLGEFEPIAWVSRLEHMQRFLELIRDCDPSCIGKVVGFGPIGS